MRERFAGLRVLRIVPGHPAHGSDKTASASPLRWGRFFRTELWRGRSSALKRRSTKLPLRRSKPKSPKGRHNAYLFKDGHDPPPDANAHTASNNYDRARLRLLSDRRHSGSKFWVLGELGHRVFK